MVEEKQEGGAYFTPPPGKIGLSPRRSVDGCRITGGWIRSGISIGYQGCIGQLGMIKIPNAWSWITVKTRMKEPPFFGVRLAKVLILQSFDRTFCPNFR